MPRKLTTAEFIAKARTKHGDCYDYAEVEYQGSEVAVAIRCAEHGVFSMTPHKHLSGRGCGRCTFVRTTDDFVAKAHCVHGLRYDYSSTEYTTSLDKVMIGCSEHGPYMQRASSHLEGVGCPKCGLRAFAAKKTVTTEGFVRRSRAAYGDLYDYSDTQYAHSHQRLTVTCRKHGPFETLPSNHIRGRSGCPQCIESRHERAVRAALEAKCIAFVPQKGFPWLQHKGPQYLDFYLPDYNVGIECQGEGHFQQVNFAGFEDPIDVLMGFHETVVRDQNKEYLCRSNGVRMIYFTLATDLVSHTGAVFHQCETTIEGLLYKIYESKER